ncbi:hypothetical protein INT47_006927 [Mucor saturninus]|uniref:Endoplasmic reticulum junction formation protein lunapark n=1 Tax=Mucor saturninus TaxID=64648 RepID=A0A8H7QSH7_9FUNG|nr:hypothetical protein INT47_006927 [Mucor saturninus]
MGGIFSREKTDSKDFEKILSDLDLSIQKAETRLSEIKIRQRRTSFMWIIYSLVIWIGCVVYLFYQMNGLDVATEDILYASIPVVSLPAAIYYIRKGLVWFYDTKQKKEEAHLLKLRQEQKGKLEELKKKTSYYSTQSLLERYDEVLAKKKEEAAKQEKMQQELRQRKPVSMPMRPYNNNGMQRPFPPATTAAPSPQQQHQQQHQQQQQPILPPPRTEPQWYDKIIDALVGDAGPETKFALICSHCFSHNGLVAKEEFDTIQYVCPQCKQFNPSRKSKQAMITKAMGEKDLTAVHEDEEDVDEVIEKLKAQIESDKDETIGARVRQRHIEEED